MDTEIELKLSVRGDVQSIIEGQVLPHFGLKANVSTFTLFNQYYDTPDRMLGQHNIGLRVRCKDGQYEQTMKTAGQVIGGLHQRPEYNVSLPSAQLDLDAFDAEIWPENLSLSRLQAGLVPLFTTDFVRTRYLLEFDTGDAIELVYDKGDVTADTEQEPLSEIELELKAGNPVRLFEVADKISEVLPAAINNLSKAARGYMLAELAFPQGKTLPGYLPVGPQHSCEQGFCLGLETAMSHVQHHEMCYLRDRKLIHLGAMHDGLQLMLQTLALYLPSLQCEALLNAHKALISHLTQWYQLDTLLGLKALRSKKGPFRKKLANHMALLSYLRGRSEGLLGELAPEVLITSSQNTRLQLQLGRLLLEKPWRGESSGHTSPVAEHAKGWLSQGWQNVLQSMPAPKHMTAQDYLSSQGMLRQTLFNGCLFGNLFEGNRDRFRAPWLDILDGTEELQTLSLLKRELLESDMEDRVELLAWSDRKIDSLLAVMERSRQVALAQEAYW